MSQPSLLKRSWLAQFPADADDSARRALWLRRTWALFGIGLVSATWPLWTPQQRFPQVPLLAGLQALPAWSHWLLGGGMLLGLAGALAAPGLGRIAVGSSLLFACATAALVAIDQHRLQPWAYQFVMVAIVLALVKPRAAVGWLRWLIITFYLYSAVTKLDHTFVHTLGQQFLGALAEPLGLRPAAWSEPARVAAALTFPLGELAVAVALCLARGRAIGLAGAVALHLLLLAILGPWGLDHKPGVLLWNMYFIVQDLLLFWPDRKFVPLAALGPAAGRHVPRTPWAIRAMLLAAMLLPVLGGTAWFDLWPSWGLYAPSAERVQLLVHRNDEARLPDALGRFVEPLAGPSEPWLVVRLDRWSLDALGAPIYPQNRFQLGVAEAVMGRYSLGHRVRVVRWELADRLTGRRQYDVLAGLPQVVAASEAYLLNSRPGSAPLHP